MGQVTTGPPDDVVLPELEVVPDVPELDVPELDAPDELDEPLLPDDDVLVPGGTVSVPPPHAVTMPIAPPNAAAKRRTFLMPLTS